MSGMPTDPRPRHRSADHGGLGSPQPGRHDEPSDDLFEDDLFEDDASTVRPYTVTGGRTAPSSRDLPVEALVQGVAAAETTTPPEKRGILELTAAQYLSVAELSAHLRLPVGVVRVLVSDLADAGAVRVHGLTPSSTYHPATTLTVLESVLDGISAL